MVYRPSPHAQPRKPLQRGAPAQPAAQAQGQYRGGQSQQPARRGQRQALTPQEQMRKSMQENGTMSNESGLPLLNEFRGRFTVEFVSHFYTDKDCLKDVVRIHESPNEDLPVGSEVLVLKSRRGANVIHTEVLEKKFNTYVVRAFGFTNEDDLNASVVDWPDQILSEAPDYLGRLAEVEVYQAFNKKTGEPVIATDKEGNEREVNEERWHASEE